MKDSTINHNRFVNLRFSDFKNMALDSNLSIYEKIGFPNSYREGKEEAVFEDIQNKLTNLQKTNQIVLDIGPGCSTLPHQLIKLCKEKNNHLILIDSEEMLSQLPDAEFITKIPAFYPSECEDFVNEYRNKIDVILSYSVLHYIFVETNIFTFLDQTLNMIADQGQCLLGDIPNADKRKRFLQSKAGVRYHQQFYDPHSRPNVEHFVVTPQEIDDAVVMSMILRARHAGFDAYVVPQAMELPMANRREDLLIFKA